MNFKYTTYLLVFICTITPCITFSNKKDNFFFPYIIPETPRAMWNQHTKKTVIGATSSTVGFMLCWRAHNSAIIATRKHNTYDDNFLFNLISNVIYAVGGTLLTSGLGVLLYTYTQTDTTNNEKPTINSIKNANVPNEATKKHIKNTFEKISKY